MLWIEEVEMVDSVDDLKSSRSIQEHQFSDFEMLDAMIASAMNKIIQNFYFKKKVSLEEQKAQLQGRFLRGKQIAFMIYEYFQVLFLVTPIYSVFTFRNDDVQEVDTRWDGILLSMSLYKLRIREFDQLTTVLEFYELEIHQEMSKPDCQKLKTMVKRS